VRFFTATASTDATALAGRLGERTLLVLDVRQPAEWRHGHIHGAQNLPVMQLKRRLATLPHDKTIVTVCASGHRSTAAARMLQRAGYQAENLKGGMHAWKRAGLQTVNSNQ
jgi:rhodanese-related sulfurtransferase